MELLEPVKAGVRLARIDVPVIAFTQPGLLRILR
jgi:hypothetical protein